MEPEIVEQVVEPEVCGAWPNPVLVRDLDALGRLLENGLVLACFLSFISLPCREQFQILKALSARSRERFTVCAVDVDRLPDCSRFGIQSIPTLVIYLDGSEAARIFGRRDEAEIIQALDRFATKCD